MNILKVYLDTSVVGGCFDEEFREASEKLMRYIRLRIFTGVVSPVTIEELEDAPENVKAVLKQFDSDELIRLEEPDEVFSLAKAYLDAKVVPQRFEDDALHIAYATVNKADVVVSWNFKHIVNLQRIHGFNAVNLMEGYSEIEIRSPKELIYGKEEEGI